jgi:methylisocitrate lyase
MARTDAIAGEGVDAAVERSVAYVEAGADMIFAEAVSELGDYSKFKDATGVPILANLTEFGKTPAFTVDELASVKVDIALYPLTVFRAANRAAENVMKIIRGAGNQRDIISVLQTRDELYEYLDYHSYENKLDELFDAESNETDPG